MSTTADIVLDEQSAPTTPAAGQGALWIDNTASQPIFKDDGGRCWGFTRSYSVADQDPGTADAYLTGSGLLIPSFGLQVGTRIIWYVAASKTAAGTATAIWQVRTGTAQTTADTSRLTITQGAQSAAADQGIAQLMLTVRTIGVTGVIRGDVSWSGHHAASVGFGNGAGAASAGFDMTTLAGQYIGLSVNAGASAAWTISQVQSELFY